MADPVTTSIMVASTAAKAYGEMSQSKAQQGMLETEASSIAQKAGWERAMGTHRQAERERDTKKLLSQQLAAAAASGGGTGGSAEEVMGATRQRGTFLSMLDQATAEESARGLDDQAAMRREAARAAAKAGRTRALTTILSGAAGIAGKMPFGADNDPTSSASWARGTTVTRYA